VRYLLIVLLVSILIAGCGSNHKTVMPIPDKTDNFFIGEIQVKALGDVIATQEDALISPAFEPQEKIPLTFPHSYFDFEPINPGTIFTARYVKGDGNFECEPQPDRPLVVTRGYAKYRMCLLINPNGELKGFSYCDYPGSSVSVSDYSGLKLNKTKSYAHGSVKKEILYNGKSKDAIKMTYREFTNDMARPAFYQDLSYELSSPMIIGFRGLEIEVIEATNTMIKYKFTKKSIL